MGDHDGYADIDDKTLCRHCGKPLIRDNEVLADGCPCNSGRGVNHGLVASDVCTCIECDPAQTGSSRVREMHGVWFQPFLGHGFLCGTPGKPWETTREEAQQHVDKMLPLDQSHPGLKSVEVCVLRRGQRYVKTAQ
jgi:hypothetical protein